MNRRVIELMIAEERNGPGHTLRHLSHPRLNEDGEWSIDCHCGEHLTAATLGDIVEIWFVHTEEDE